MTIEEIRNKVFTSDEYKFIRTDELLHNNIILLYLSGSYAYGTNTENSDVDVRGVALNSKRQILLGQDFGSILDTNTDTVIYSFKKMIKMLCSNNPSAIEIFGLKPEHILFSSFVGEDLLKRKDMFLTKKVGYAFKGYIEDSLIRLLPDNNMSNEKLSKYMVHPVRLFYMAKGILKYHKVRTYRDKEHSLLMYIRDGKAIGADGKPTDAYYKLIDMQKTALDQLIANCDLPDKVDQAEVDDYVASICEMIVKRESL